VFIRWKYLINCGNPAALGSDQVVPSLFFLLIRVVHVDKSVDDLEGVLGKQGFFLYIGCWHPTRAHPHFPSNPAALRSPLYIFALTPISILIFSHCQPNRRSVVSGMEDPLVYGRSNSHVLSSHPAAGSSSSSAGAGSNNKMESTGAATKVRLMLLVQLNSYLFYFFSNQYKYG